MADKTAGRRLLANKVCVPLVPIVFMAILSLNLLFPSPTGPADNGDFTRIFASFSSGPLNYEFWPSPADTKNYQERFFTSYHRFWRHDGGKEGASHFTSSALIFWPGRLLKQDSSLFDLAWNSLWLVLISGLFFYFCLKKVNDLYATLSMGIFAIFMADLNIAGYVNSFYQESGAFVSFLLLVFVLHVFFARRTLASLVMVSVIALILAAAKVVYIPSVLIAVFCTLAGVAYLGGESPRMRRLVVIACSLMFLASFLLSLLTLSTPGNERQANCYHYIFSEAIPRLDPAQGEHFLRELDLDPSLIALSGKDAYQADSQFGELRRVLTTELQTKAIARLAFSHPGAFLQSIRFSFSRAGFYPSLSYPPPGAASLAPRPFKWDAWSRLRNSFLHGGVFFMIVFALIILLGIVARRQREPGWPLFHLILAGSFFLASLPQIFISVLGNGPLDIEKHQYLANLLLDAAFIFTLTALIKSGLDLRKKEG